MAKKNTERQARPMNKTQLISEKAKMDRIEYWLKTQPHASAEKREEAEKQYHKLLFSRNYIAHLKGVPQNNTKEIYNPKTGKFYSKKKKKYTRAPKYKIYTDSFGKPYKVYSYTNS